MRLELTQACAHYHLKVACIPISPPRQFGLQKYGSIFAITTFDALNIYNLLANLPLWYILVKFGRNTKNLPKLSNNVSCSPMAHPLLQAQFEKHKVCIIIPTYNNAATLAQVIDGVMAYTNHIIVVNDGSTDDTESIIERFSDVQSISYLPNVGKGWALRRAFEYAIAKGYKFAITIDSDGQHFAKDLPQFVDKLETAQDAIVIGSRNMNQASVPAKSSFGHRFSNFWFWVETSIKAPDTQSGFRLYPIDLLKEFKFYTRKFEFEIEVLVTAAWHGIKIDSVPVTVYYAPQNERVTHFRPFQDFSRISVLNTVLVIIALLYIKPRDLIRDLKKKNIRQLLRENLMNPDESDEKKALSIGFGFFMGIVPIWGFQILTAIFLSVLFKLNKALVLLAANISLPPLIPFIIYLSVQMGGLWLGDKAQTLTFDKNLSLDVVSTHFAQYIYGGVSLALAAGLVGGLVAYLFIKISKK
jgi:glycosyltransferase involved in cell wall biosynthesis